MFFWGDGLQVACLGVRGVWCDDVAVSNEHLIRRLWSLCIGCIREWAARSDLKWEPTILRVVWIGFVPVEILIHYDGIMKDAGKIHAAKWIG